MPRVLPDADQDLKELASREDDEGFDTQVAVFFGADVPDDEEPTQIVGGDFGERARERAMSRAERTAVIEWLTENYGASGSEAVQVADTEEEAVGTTETETEAEAEASAAVDELPFDRQANTGVELWQFLIAGGTLMAGGAWMRRR